MPDSLLHWEDIEVGRVVDLGPYELTRDEILSFARTYDPQPFHIDEVAAKGSISFPAGGRRARSPSGSW